MNNVLGIYPMGTKAIANKEISTVWIVWDPLYEKVMSAHKTEKAADKRCADLNEKDDRYKENTYWYENEEFKLED